MFYSTAIAISTYSIVPTDSYLGDIIGYDFNSESYLSESFNNYGYSYRNVLMNLGTLSFFLFLKVQFCPA